MLDTLTRRDILKTAAALAAGTAAAERTADAQPGAEAFGRIDTALRTATRSGDVPGVVAMAATDRGVVYEGVFGTRRVPDGPAMTRDTVFRIASMVKLITSVAALQLVEQNKLSLDDPVPAIDPALSSPQVLDGFDKGKPLLRPARRPITLRHLLTHTAGFTYALWDAKAVQYFDAVQKLPPIEKNKAPRTPLMFDPGERWQYGPNIDWVGRIVERISGERLEIYFQRHIFSPLGMKDTAFVITGEQRAREASGHKREADGSLLAEPQERQIAGQSFSGGGGIYSTAQDYLTLLRALLAGGSLDGVSILRPDTVALMGQNQIGTIEAGILKTTRPTVSKDVSFFPGVSLKWGLGHMINMQPGADGRSAGSLTWAGLLNTYYWIDPRRHIAAVFMTQVLPFADEPALRVYHQFERGLYYAIRSG
jgi:CubicO group peptidase (beta-lactamase class C family)